jgi:hypothetical protein
LVAVFVRDKVMWPFSDMAAVVFPVPRCMLLGVYAAQCYEDRRFMAPAQAVEASGARSLVGEGWAVMVEEEAAVYAGYAWFQSLSAMRGIWGLGSRCAWCAGRG